MTGNRINIALGIIALVAVALFVVYSQQINNDKASPWADDVTFRNIEVTIFKSSGCACCQNYQVYLSGQGFTVMTIDINDMAAIKELYQIPKLLESCHTAVIEGYFVEGHIPVQVIDKLLREKPDIDGIALPGMPQGSPGMPGEQLEPLLVYALSAGESVEFITIANN